MVCVVLIGVGWGFAIPFAVMTQVLWRARERTYDYAVAKSKEHGLTERGSAYSDMATVIVLDGKVSH